MAMFIHFFCLCPISLTIKVNFNISKVAYSFALFDVSIVISRGQFHCAPSFLWAKGLVGPQVMFHFL